MKKNSAKPQASEQPNNRPSACQASCHSNLLSTLLSPSENLFQSCKDESLISSEPTTTRNNKFQQRMSATNESIFTFQIGLRPPRPSSASLPHNLDAEVPYPKPSQPKITAKENPSLPKLPLPTLIRPTVLHRSRHAFSCS